MLRNSCVVSLVFAAQWMQHSGSATLVSRLFALDEHRHTIWCQPGDKGRFSPGDGDGGGIGVGGWVGVGSCTG